MKEIQILVIWILTEFTSIYCDLRIGGALNFFGRYGYMSISMRVVPRNDSEKWIFREPLVDIFKNVPVIRRSQPRSSNQILNGDFHMEFCDDLTQLFQAYFREFTVERFERSWEAFTASWTIATVAKNLGIDSSFIHEGNCFVLIRLSRYREAARVADTFVPGSADIHDSVASRSHDVVIGNYASVGSFVKSFGSHYITSYVTGNALFQIMVYNQEDYLLIKTRLKSKGISAYQGRNLTNLFSPLYVKHIGKILTSSGNETVNEWAKSALQLRSYYITYNNILKIHGNTKLLKELDNLLGNEALLHLDLRTLSPIFKDRTKKEWFQEVLDNDLKLWEINL